MLGNILDGTVIFLLLITINYAIRLSAKLNVIKNQKQEFAANIKAFSEATEAAILAVEELHVKGENVCKIIDEKIKKGELMGDEIEFLINKAAKKLAEMNSSHAQVAATLPNSATRAPVQVNSIAEAQLLKALRDREFKEALLAH